MTFCTVVISFWGIIECCASSFSQRFGQLYGIYYHGRSGKKISNFTYFVWFNQPTRNQNNHNDINVLVKLMFIGIFSHSNRMQTSNLPGKNGHNKSV